jgi:hypothetical protein
MFAPVRHAQPFQRHLHSSNALVACKLVMAYCRSLRRWPEQLLRVTSARTRPLHQVLRMPRRL